MPVLFDPLTIRGVTFRNRIGISPMQQYCAADDGRPTDWHMANLLPRAQSGAGLVFVESTSVARQGRVGYGDLGLWEDTQIPAHARLAQAIRRTGAVAGVQLGHGGRKSSRNPRPGRRPAIAGLDDGGSQRSAVWRLCRAARHDRTRYCGGGDRIRRWGGARCRGRLPDRRTACGTRLFAAPVPVAVGEPAQRPVWRRLRRAHAHRARGGPGGACRVAGRDPTGPAPVAHTDWAPGGWTTEETVQLAIDLQGAGVDLLDISSGGMSPDQQIPLGPGYQVPGAEAVRKACTIAVASVGMITEPHQAQAIVEQGKADLVLLARASMRDPQWPLTAAIALGRPDALRIPPQFDRGWGAFGPLEMDFSLAEPFAPLA